MKKGDKEGFSLIELIIYVAIFAVSSTFLVAILTSVTRIQTRQSYLNEVNQQLSFVKNTIQRFIHESSLVDIPSGNATSTLTLRMASSSRDSTLIYTDSNKTAIYLREGSGTAQAITDSKIRVDNFSVTKYENPGGSSIVQVDITLTASTTNPQAQVTRSLRTAITRISAASFDSNLLPNANNTYDFGNASYNWKDGYLSGYLGIGVSPTSNARIKTTGDIAFTTSSVGLILVAPNGNCYRLGINNSAQVTTSSITCP